MMKKVMIAGFVTPDEKYENYMDAMERLGAQPFISLNVDDFEEADALILPGSFQDMNPKLWGAEDECSNDINDELDSIQWELMERAVSSKKPVLGICRGMQFIDVFFGGTLIQDLPCSDSHKAAEAPEKDNYHNVAVVEGTKLFGLYGEETETNTRHHQGIGLVGEGLKVSAMWVDGFPIVMEAVEHKELPIIGVQWHPERMYIYGNERQKEAGKKLLEYWLGL